MIRNSLTTLATAERTQSKTSAVCSLLRSTRTRYTAIFASLILMAYLALQPSEYRIVITGTVTEGSVAELFLNDFRDEPLRVSLVPGQRATYDFHPWRDKITRLRLDPSASPAAVIQLERIEVLRGDKPVAAFSDADLAAWSSGNLVPASPASRGAVWKATSNDPQLISPKLNIPSPDHLSMADRIVALAIRFIICFAVAVFIAHSALVLFWPSGTELQAADRRLAATIRREVPLAAAYSGFAMLLTLHLGQDLSWDLRNYHFYAPYLFLTNRFHLDIYTAAAQSYLNPFLDVPLYVGVRYFKLPPVVIGLGLAAIHGLALWLVHRIVVLLLKGAPTNLVGVLATFAAVTSAFGSGYRALVGMTSGDVIIAVLVLGALASLLASLNKPPETAGNYTDLSGILIGLSIGAKLFGAVYAAGILCALLAVTTGPQRFRCGLRFIAFAVVGAFVSGGYWMLTLLYHYQSPLFPLYNTVWRSPYASDKVDYLINYGPPGLLTALLYPVHFAFPSENVVLASAAHMRDARFAAGLFAIMLLVAAALIRRPGKPHSYSGRPASTAPGHAVLNSSWLVTIVFVLVSYPLWLALLNNYRFAVALELLLGAIIVSAAATLFRASRKTLAAAIPVCLILILHTKPLDLGRIPWSSSHFGVNEEQLAKYQGATFVMWGEPNGFLAPHFPDSNAFVRIENGANPGTQMWKVLVERLTAAKILYTLETGTTFDERRNAMLASVGLFRDDSQCELIRSFAGPSRICKLLRAAVPQRYTNASNSSDLASPPASDKLPVSVMNVSAGSLCAGGAEGTVHDAIAAIEASDNVVLTRKRDRVKLIATSTDPILVLQPLKDSVNQIRIKITAPAQTSLEVYQISADPSWGAHPVRASLKAGYNEVLLDTPSQNAKTLRFRIDPGNVKGEYQIHELSYIRCTSLKSH